MSEKTIPGKLIKAFHVGNKRVFANKFTGKSGVYYRINIQSSNFDDVKLFVFPNEIDEYIEMFKLIAEDVECEDQEEIEEKVKVEPKLVKASAVDNNTCEQCGGLDFEIYPGRGTQCTNCGKIYWMNSG